MAILKWEKVHNTPGDLTDRTPAGQAPSLQTIRASVPGGWIVRTSELTSDGDASQTFVPDPKHEWK